MIITVVIDIAVLGFFKYFNAIPLPLGISFFTFQMIAAIADVYKEKTKIDTFGEFALFIMFFPQLSQGPILRYQELDKSLKDRNVTGSDLEDGTRRFLAGFAKKVLIADKLSSVTDTVFGLAVSGIPMGYAWMGAISYALVIYFDFSGYSDMAIGLSRIFGFHIMENFNYPYMSRTITDFWRRWHISLSSWFRDYVYIPLGGNRKGTYYTYRNLFLVFLLTGIWHGADLTFMIWGIYHGIFVLIEKAGLKKVISKLPVFVGHFYCCIVVLVGWVFFRAENMAQALCYIKSMFIPTNITYRQIGILTQLNWGIIFLMVMGCLLSAPIIKSLDERFYKSNKYQICKDAILLLVFVTSIVAMLTSSFNPSIYTKF